MKMKKATFALLLIFLVALLNPALSESNIEVPEHLKNYIDCVEKKIPYKKISDKEGFPLILSREKYIEDIDMMEYLFDNAYAGKAYWEKNGMDFKAFFQERRDKTKNADWIGLEKFMDVVEKGFAPICDNHMSITGSRLLRFGKHKQAYFSNLLVGKVAAGFEVLSSLEPEVATGSIYTGSKDLLFPTLSPERSEHFLVGTFTFEPVETIELNFGNKTTVVSVHKCRAGSFENPDEEAVKQERIKGIPVVSVRSFSAPHEILDKFARSGSKFRKEKILVYNLMKNSGGGSAYGGKFIENLNDVADWRRTGGTLESAPTIQEKAKTPEENMGYDKKEYLEAKIKARNPESCSYRRWLLAPPYGEQKKGSYKGKLIVIGNRRVASAGESGVAYCRSVKNCIFVGENTYGMGMFGNAVKYVLPNSRITLRLCKSLFIMPDFEEGVGFIPDLWVDSADTVNEIIEWLKNPKKYQFKLHKAEN